jgi:hypothetical protein
VETIKRAVEVNTRFQFVGLGFCHHRLRANTGSPVWAVLAPGGFWLARCQTYKQSLFTCGLDRRHHFSQSRLQLYQFTLAWSGSLLLARDNHSACPFATHQFLFAFAPFRVSLKHNPALPST